MNKDKGTSIEDDALLEALTPIVTKLIDKNYESSQDKIALQMAPLIGSAIREQIKSSKEDVIDALYPVMGSMISRYVTKMLEETLSTINEQIQNGLSFKALSRKFRAKVRGVSETELLLNESSASNVRALLLIHKETGIVLAEAHNPNTPLEEPEMIASMMSAIRSFVNDWIDKNRSDNELGEIEYGGNKIILENSGYSYLAVIVDGAAYGKTYESIRKTLEVIVMEHGEAIKEFNGDLSDFPNMAIYKKISSLLSSESAIDEKTTKTHPLIYAVPIFLLAFISFHLYNGYIDSSVSKSVREKISNEKQLTLYKIDVETQNKIVTLKGQVPYQYYKDLTQSILKNVDGVETLNNQIQVVSTLEDPMQVKSNVAYLLNGLNANDGINLTYSYSYPNLEINGETWDKRRKLKAIGALKAIKGVRNVRTNIHIIPPSIKEIVYFKKGSSKLSAQSELKLIRLSQKLSSLDKETILSLNGYSDESGTLSANTQIVNQRVKNVATALKEITNISQVINGVSNYHAPKDINASLTPHNARCVIISLEK